MLGSTRNRNAPEPDGSRVFREVTPGRYTLRVWYPNGPRRDLDIELRAGEERVIEVRPKGGAAVKGVVVGPGGGPVAGVDVAWMGEKHANTNTDERGRFNLTGLDAGPGTVKVDSLWLRYTPAAVEGVVPGGEPLRIVLERGARLHGRIIGLPKGTSRVRCDLYSAPVSSGGEMETAAEGRFERRAPVREPMVIAITVEGYPPIVVDVPALEPGVTHDIGTVRLDGGRTAHARVVDDTGAPVQGAIVTIPEPWPDLDLAARTGKDGVFRLPLMPRRPLHLRIKATGYPVHFVVHETDGGTIALGRGGLLDVRLVEWVEQQVERGCRCRMDLAREKRREPASLSTVG